MNGETGHEERLLVRIGRGLLVAGLVLLTLGAGGCGRTVIPKEYVRQAELGVTLTKLSKDPMAYRGKVVILGGVIVDQKQGDNRVWLRVKNRPLDEDFVPHIPVANEGPEAGQYWVMVWNKDLPKDYQKWARVTVVGRVASGQAGDEKAATGEGLVLFALYLRGWGKDFGGYLTQTDDSGFVRPPAAPKPLQKNTTF